MLYLYIMNKTKNYVTVLTILLLTGGLLVSVGYFANKYLDNKTTVSRSEKINCNSKGVNHKFEIRNSVFMPSRINAKLCDSLTITNRDDKIREIAFGNHSQHIAYDGVFEKTLAINDKFTVTLNQIGSFKIHDHFQDETQAYFVVE